MTTKVNNTVSHKTSQGDVLVTKGKLVLILNPDIWPEVWEIGEYFDGNKMFLNTIDPTERESKRHPDCGVVSPIIISETEKIEVGDIPLEYSRFKTRLLEPAKERGAEVYNNNKYK